MKKKIMLFDIDGTLVKAGGSGLLALNRAIVSMGGKKNICDYFQLQGSTDNVNFTNAFISAFGRKPNKKEFQILKEKYLKYLPLEVKKAVKYKRYKKIKGIEKFLNYLLKRKDILIGLGTGNLKEGAYHKLKPSGFFKYFNFGGYGTDSFKRDKVLQKAVKRAEKILKEKVNPGQVYVIGDTEKDVEAAKSSGYHIGIVLDGFGNVEKIRKNSPEIMEKNFSNLKPWLIWLGLEKDPKGIKKGTYVCPDTPIEHAYYGMTGNGSFLSQKDFEKIDKIIKIAKKDVQK